MNRIILIGNLTKDPESSTTQGGVNFARFQIAVNRMYADANGERVADYFDIICWRQLADRCMKYLYKGSKVGINGTVQRRQYEDRDGVKRTSFTVVADEVEFLTPRSSADGYQNSHAAPEEPRANMSDLEPVSDEDLPF